MCFKDKFGFKLIGFRRYRNLSGHQSFRLNKNKKSDRTLVLELVNEKGNFEFRIINNDTKEEIVRNNLKTGIYEFKILINNSYQVHFVTSKTSGSYKLRIG